MSRSVDLFVGARLPLEELAAALTDRLELALRADPEGQRYLVTQDGVTLVLHAHPYVDDDGLPFTRYPYALSAVVDNGARPQDSAQARVLRQLAQRIQQGPAWPVLLVLDLQFRDAALHPESAPAADAAGGTETAPPDREAPDGEGPSRVPAPMATVPVRGGDGA